MNAGEPSKPEREALALCRSSTKRQARSFYVAMSLTPEPAFSKLCVVYTWMQAADDLADAPGSFVQPGLAVQPGLVNRPEADSNERATAQQPQRRAAVEAFWNRTLDALNGHPGPTRSATQPRGDPTLWTALSFVARTTELPREALRGVIDGQLADLSFEQPRTEPQLDGYCHRVASTVGQVCVAVWGGDPVATGGRAEARGIALQRTNILRDLAEDAARGRVYLPTESLERHGVHPGDLAALPPDDGARLRISRLMREQLDVARSWYARSEGLEARLPRGGRASSAAIGGVYRTLLNAIAADPLAVLERRVRPPRRARLGAVARAWASAKLPAGLLTPIDSRP